MSYSIGIDVGTASVRCMIFDDKYMPIVQCQKSIEIYHTPGTQHYEQSSNEIWTAICYCVKNCISTGNININYVKSIGFDATCSLVVLDEKFEPVTVSLSENDERNIIMWMDHRAGNETTEINLKSTESCDDVLKFYGGKISLEQQPGKLLWLKRNMKQNVCWKRAKHFFDLPDFLRWKATGSLERSVCSCVCKLCYRSSEEKQYWDEKFWSRFDMNDLCENNFEKLGTTVRKPFSTSNFDLLSKNVAEELGIKDGIRVGTPLIDAYAGALGGLACKSPVKDSHLTERLVIVAGTSSCFMACSKKPVFVPGVWGPYYDVLIPGLWVSEGGQSAAGKSIDYIVQGHIAYSELKALADQENKTPFDMLIIRLQELEKKHNTANISFLTANIHMTVDFHGNRAPVADPDLGAVISGIKLDNSLDNLALQYLAVIQAIAYDGKHIIEAMTKAGHRFKQVQICGGLSRIPLLPQIHADVFQMPVYICEGTNDCVLLGSAISGKLVADNATDVEHLLNEISAPVQTFIPDKNMADFHNEKYTIYCSLQQIEIFRECDRRGKGYLDAEDMKVASIRVYGSKMNKYEIERLFSSLPKDSPAGLTLDSFISYVQSFDKRIDPEDQNRETFLAMDRTCKGFLTKEDFYRAFEKLNIKLSNEVIDSAFRQLDVDGDGRVSYRDFDFMMNYDPNE